MAYLVALVLKPVFVLIFFGVLASLVWLAHKLIPPGKVKDALFRRR